MGIFKKVNPAKIRPSQDFLKEDTLTFIAKHFDTGDFDKLPPAPIVRIDPQGEYIAIDGHNLLAFCTHRKIDCDVYIAESADDILPGDSEMIIKRNEDLKNKYDTVLIEADKIKEKGIDTIEALWTFSNIGIL